MRRDGKVLSAARPAVGIWAQWPPGARWSNEGMTRLLGFLIEGIARGGKFVFRIVLPDSVRDTAEADLRTLDATIGRDFTLHSPQDHGMPSDSFPDLAKFANRHVPVDGWLTLFPNFSFAKLLDAPVTVVFPDAIPKSFHEFGDIAWGAEGGHLKWENAVKELLAHAKHAVTFSRHVARDHLEGLFGFPAGRATAVPHACPDLQNLIPGLANRRRSSASLADAADRLRRECGARGWDYLRDFPFEQVPFIAVSTQDRVTKNIQLAARSLQILLKDRRHDFKILMTAPLHFGHAWTVLPSLVEKSQTQFDIVSMPDLPREEHAALLHCAAITVHPSIFEGGHAPFPFYESVSIGTPCVMAAGPHIAELAEEEPDLLKYTFDPNNACGLADMIVDALARRDQVIAEQQEIYDRMLSYDWAAVAAAYAQAAIKQA